ncbi:MAG: ABC-F family ATP-binding cassette domain-containing protein [Chloroflexi bacterium]|nr:ABC-F family ATP-binding cassette domain-containing protein [Ardenticatenaceae bacterium]MBL1127329.1 ABC transporter ATP-binding protein [Chloroflexota bacterium]NOG33390.1 ABC-F family ATP-binding cassette domain-containing protein [Chloroflexota bacterium]GIK57207.1 MAG: multidrug ABC transporter ATP-binding protein [Chloroflexota bacterium]
MNLLTLENLSHYYSERLLLDKVNLLINEGDRIGLIGRNGSGKTTLLRLIAGLEMPRNGRISRTGHVRVHYLPQEPHLDDNLTVLDAIFQSDAPQMRLLRDFNRASDRLHHDPHNPALQAAFAELSHQMDHTGGWAAEADAKTILTRLGITQFDAPVSTLSGGQYKRVALAHALLYPADLLVLDEPTNHIDADTIAWLEDYLLKRPGALLMVTHDRYFLERVVNKIVELDRRQLVLYPGNYGRYLEQRTRRDEQLSTAETKRQGILRRELEWLRRGAQARSTKQKARKQRIEELREIQYDRGDERVALALASRRLGKRVLEATGLSKSYSDLTLFQNLDFHLDPGDRIGVIGPNGAGKSTFLDVLAGKTAADSGMVEWGQTVQLGYYDQHASGLPENKRVIEYINSIAPNIRTADGEKVEAAQMLEWFLFSRPEQQSTISSLSGGERRRLYLLATLIHQPNVLFLDEPTNDLDVQTLTVLEQFLDNFAGCLVVVSHDRFFLDRNVDFLASFEDGVLGTRYPTPFESYQQLRAVETKTTQPAPTPKPTPLPAKTTERPRKLTWQEKRELETLDTAVPTLEARIAELETAINQAGGDYARLQTLVAELERVKVELDTAVTRWLELSEIGGE